jgi:hypothetical protein
MTSDNPLYIKLCDYAALLQDFIFFCPIPNSIPSLTPKKQPE